MYRPFIISYILYRITGNVTNVDFITLQKDVNERLSQCDGGPLSQQKESDLNALRLYDSLKNMALSLKNKEMLYSMGMSIFNATRDIDMLKFIETLSELTRIQFNNEPIEDIMKQIINHIVEIPAKNLTSSLSSDNEEDSDSSDEEKASRLKVDQEQESSGNEEDADSSDEEKASRLKVDQEQESSDDELTLQQLKDRQNRGGSRFTRGRQVKVKRSTKGRKLRKRMDITRKTYRKKNKTRRH
jgi:hypothetical protein